ncbi:MAG: hypothetical protein ABIT71_18490 [Vicinamibacteraceae bacterium]
MFDDFPIIGQASRWPLRDIVGEPLMFFYRPGLFLWMRAAHFFFGWHSPQGYAALAVAVHAVNAGLVGVLAARFFGKGAAAWTAATLFFVGPWSAEAVFWISGGFDLLATCGALVAVLTGVAFCVSGRSRRIRVALLATCIVGTLLALFTKESTVALAGLFALAAWGGSAEASLSRKRAGIVLGLMLVATVAYLVIRSVVVSSLTGGAYGDWFTLMASADVFGNAASFARAALVWPAPHDAGMHAVGVMARTGMASSACVLLLALMGALLRRRAGLALVTALILCVLPVLWLGLQSGSSGGGRVLYLPGVPFVLLCALGLQELMAQPRRWIGWSATGALAVVLVTALGSVNSQGTVWAEAFRLSRASVEAFRPFVGQVDPIHIENLPFWFLEGPYVIKSYAFAYYYYPASVPPASATALTLVSVGGRVTVTTRGPEPGAGAPVPGARSVALAIGLR